MHNPVPNIGSVSARGECRTSLNSELSPIFSKSFLENVVHKFAKCFSFFLYFSISLRLINFLHILEHVTTVTTPFSTTVNHAKHDCCTVLVTTTRMFSHVTASLSPTFDITPGCLCLWSPPWIYTNAGIRSCQNLRDRRNFRQVLWNRNGIKTPPFTAIEANQFYHWWWWKWIFWKNCDNFTVGFSKRGTAFERLCKNISVYVHALTHFRQK